MFAIIFLVSMLQPAQHEVRHGMLCSAPHELASDATATVRDCVPLRDGAHAHGQGLANSSSSNIGRGMLGGVAVLGHGH